MEHGCRTPNERSGVPRKDETPLWTIAISPVIAKGSFCERASLPLAPEAPDLSPQLLNLVLQVAQPLISISSATRSNPTYSTGRRAVSEVRILGRGVAA